MQEKLLNVVGYYIGVADTDNFSENTARREGTFKYYTGGIDKTDYVQWWSDFFGDAYIFKDYDEAERKLHSISNESVLGEWNKNHVTQLFPYDNSKTIITMKLFIRPIAATVFSKDIVKDNVAEKKARDEVDQEDALRNETEHTLDSDQIRQYKETVQNIIKNHGRFIQGVAGDDGYMYTIGNTHNDAPELLIVGTFNKALAQVINNVSDKLISEKEYSLDEFTVEGIMIAGEKARFKLRPVSYREVCEDRTISHEVHGVDPEKVKMVQILWADQTNFPPDEPLYDKTRFPQKVYSPA